MHGTSQINNEPDMCHNLQKTGAEIYNSVKITESNSSSVCCTDQTIFVILHPVLVTTMQK